ncbi:hypothetical protein OZX57_05620 [Bifidobacterium sp. ESL0682]|uniref:hypothetical protein n=1 Tax=Bifidobacterium sp. ESL0682 TaxID=2983212 RepID=UPI0023F99C14|nr:hypothetical protein [Bifidobacterium sp. ESL0682]WEV41511.1 hypothetical protein OZX57_05620 [Bifidobacterium sp. ESL0682]
MAQDTQNMNDDGGNEQWYFNTVTGKPELGKLSPVNQRSGPYKSRKDAENAWKIAKKRNEVWDEQNRKWNAWDRAGEDDGSGEGSDSE